MKNNAGLAFTSLGFVLIGIGFAYTAISDTPSWSKGIGFGILILANWQLNSILRGVVRETIRVHELEKAVQSAKKIVR